MHRFLENEEVKSLLLRLDEDAKQAITKLKTAHIKKFMKDHFDEKQDTQIINDVFNTIVNNYSNETIK